mmetsp:Transcript_53799/g.158339  ORF Transcript_53799/g.158339 Transcript_53799/m.158339 type:complete len:219 (+) Transcript_53799:1426-2082(+)
MKLRCVSCTLSSLVCQQHSPKKPTKIRTTAVTTGVFTSCGAKTFSMKLPMRPPLCFASVQQSIWFGSFLPSSRALQASSWGFTGQQGQPLRQRHGQQSILLAATRRASNVASAAKKKICRRKSARMQSAAYMQNAERAGRADETEMAKATKSVRDVTMIETPACEMASAMRLGTGSSGSVWSKAFMITKESSTPMPRITNGRMPCTGVYGKPIHIERP